MAHLAQLLVAVAVSVNNKVSLFVENQARERVLPRIARAVLAATGAGFTTTRGYVKGLPEKLPSYQEACLHIYDAVDYAENAFDMKGSCGFSFGNGCSDGATETSLFGGSKARTIPIKSML